MGEIDKVWAPLAGKPVLSHSVENLGSVCAEVVVVVRSDQTRRAMSLFGSQSNLRVVPGGDERRTSVAAGLQALGDVEYVAVHDSARPLATSSLLQKGLEMMRDSVAAVPVVLVSDTVKRVDHAGGVVETVARGSLRLAQTPQIFHPSVLRQAHAAHAVPSELATDDASLVEALGRTIATFPGDVRNLKITTPLDLELVRCIFESSC
jgi:2-C-methyl-D-erythritol 4-phosphate cytidylyltransferase